MATKLLRASVEIIVPRGDKFLTVTNRRWGGFSMPGGKVEDSESIEEAAHRELYEETGLKGDLTFVAASFTPAKLQGQLDWVCFTYLLGHGRDQEPRQMEEGTVPSWSSTDDLLTNSMYPDHYCYLLRLL